MIIKAESTSVSWWLQLLAGIVPWLLIFGFFYFISRRMQERLAGGPGIFGIGKSKAHLYSEADTRLTFIDDEIRELLSRQQEISGRVLKANRQYLDSLAQALLNEETLGREAIKAVLQEAKMPESVADAAWT